MEKEITDIKLRNWVKSCLALQYFKEGIIPFISEQCEDMYIQNVSTLAVACQISVYQCTNCSIDMIKPSHAQINTCNYKKCNCKRKNTVRCQENGSCSKMYDLLKNLHVKSEPNFSNTDCSLWSDKNRGPWEQMKCFISTPGYKDTDQIAKADVTALLQICENNTTIRNLLKNIYGQLQQIKEDRNAIYHSVSMKVSNADLQDYIARIKNVLALKLFEKNELTTNLLSKLNKLEASSFGITTLDEIKIREKVLKTLQDSKNEFEKQGHNNAEELKRILITEKVHDNTINQLIRGVVKHIDDLVLEINKTTLHLLENKSDVYDFHKDLSVSIGKLVLWQQEHGVLINESHKEIMPGRNSLAVDTVPVEIQLNTTSKADMLTNMEGMKEGMRSLLKEDKRLLFSSRAKDKMSGGNLSVKDIFPVKKRKRLRITPIPGASLQQKLEWCRRRSSTGSSDATDLEWSDDIDAELTDTGFESSDDNYVELTDSNDSHCERSSTTSPETICGRILAIENVLQVYPAYTFENVDDVVFVVIVEIESDELIPCINDLEINYVVKNISLSSYGKNSSVIKSKIRGENTMIRNEITYNGNMQRSEKQREEDVSVLVETQLSKKGNEELTKTTICTSGVIPIQKDHNERLGQTVISSEMQLSEEQKTRLSSCIQKNASVLMVNHKWLCIIEGCSYQVEINKTMYEPGLLLYVPVKGFIPIGEEPFKKSYDDIRVFVREGVFRYFHGHADEYHENVRMGCQIHGTALGTLGVFIEHPSHGLCGLTCAHVVLDDNIICNQEIDGHRYFVSNEHKVWQPKPPDAIGCIKEVIIKEGNHSQAGMEIVLIQMEQRFPVNGNFPKPKIGAIDISFTSGKTAGPNVNDVNCFKFGSATDYTEGKIIRGSNCVRDICSSNCLSIPLFNLFKIVPCGTVFADRGDSGAPVFVIDVTGEPVCLGIIEGGNSFNEVYVTHIQDILKECGNSRLKSFDDIIIINQKISEVAHDVKELYKAHEKTENKIDELYKAHEKTENKIDELGQKMDFYFGQLLGNRGSSNQ